MSQSGQDGSDYDSEPASIRQTYLYQGKEHFDRVVDLESVNVNCRSMYLTEYDIFIIDARTYQRDFLDFTETIRAIICTLSPATITLIVKMPGETHVHVGAAFHDAIGDVLRTMGIRGAIVPYRRVNSDVNGISEQPDSAWAKHNPPRWLTAVVEIVMSETKKKLQQDMHLWLDPARSKVNIFCFYGVQYLQWKVI
ncbi:hypothetical protein N7530_010318 [Penicillium desertorum]|uniref:Uncharacterized protein n=1 Tax=Penicillium desertorum TaxID=1303715 RepID=A0A9W9WKA5_9EURO|nr:hypothetical protein N7530_011425 [Penicillium desertorum]KAJ5466531.1 hypothetical protein N7530_010318 [Penicillium desertorum]